MEQLIIITTSDTIQNHQITEYLGLVSARSWSFNGTIQFDPKKPEKNIENYRKFIEEAETCLMLEAKKKGANAVIGVSIEREKLAAAQFLIMYGTAVRIE